MVQQYRLRLLLAVTFVSIAAAQSNLPSQITPAANPLATPARSYPPCAEVCLARATGSLPCSESDSACLCAHQDDVRSSVESCLIESSACPAADSSAAANYYPNICRALGLDQNGEPVIAIPTGGMTTATTVDGLVPITTGSPTNVDPTSSPTTTTTASPDQGASKQNLDDNGGLSVATVAGIAAGCAFIVVAIITGLIWMYIKKRDGDEELAREIESLSKKPKPGFESSTSSFKTPAQKSSEKNTEYALSSLPSQPPPAYSRSTKPTLADRRNHSAKPLQRSPSETLHNSSYPFPFGDKTAAEASMTSLALPNSASKPVSAIIIQKSPARSQFSDQASIYSVSSIHSEEAQIHRISDTRTERPNTFYNLYSGGAEGQSTTNLVTPQQTSSRGKGQGSLRRNKFDLQVTAPPPVGSSTDVRDSINPFTTPPATKAVKNPFETSPKEPRNSFDATSPARPNPLRQNPNESALRRSLVKSGNSFGKFDFEIAQEARSSSGRRSSMALRDSFFNGLDLGLGLFDGRKK